MAFDEDVSPEGVSSSYRKVQSLMTSDPEEARKEQMICIRLSKEIMALGRA